MNGTPERGERCACGCPTCEYCTFGWNQPKCESHHRLIDHLTGRGKYADEICSDCDHDECELWAEAQPPEEPDPDECPPTHPEDCPSESECATAPSRPEFLEAEARDAMSLEIKRLTDLVIDLEEIIVYQAGVIREKAEVIEEMEADNKA